MQRKARDDLLQSFGSITAAYEGAKSTYLSGKFAGKGAFSPVISPLIKGEASLVQCGLAYKGNLLLLHSAGLAFPEPKLFETYQRFISQLKSCIVPADRGCIAELIRLSREFNTFLLDDRSSPIRHDRFDKGLTEHFDGMKRLVTEDICTAIIAREEAIKDNLAVPIPQSVEEMCRAQELAALDSDWKRWLKRAPRFKCSANGADIVDAIHYKDKDWPRIEPYLKLPPAAQKVVSLLLAAASRKDPDDWWIPSTYDGGRSFSGAFQRSAKSAHRFYNDQIEVGTNLSHKGQWRILPDALFADRYWSNYPKRDALLGS